MREFRAVPGLDVTPTMNSVLKGRDPGALGRFLEIIEHEDTMPVVVQRLTAGDTLKEIAEGWQVPYGRLAQWIVEDRTRSEQYNAALAIWADALAQETVGIADDVTADRDEVAKAKLKTHVRMALAGKWNRPRYGDSTEVKHTGHVSLVAILSSMPSGNVYELPAQTSLEKIPEKIPEIPPPQEELI